MTYLFWFIVYFLAGVGLYTVIRWIGLEIKEKRSK